MSSSFFSLRSEERVGRVLAGRSQRRVPGPAAGRGPGMAAGRRERPHLPAETRQLGSAHSYGETVRR